MKKTLTSLLSFLILSTAFVACTADDTIDDSMDDSIGTESEEKDAEEDNSTDDFLEEYPDDDEIITDYEYSLDDYVSAVKDAYGEDYSPNMELSEDEIEEKFGLSYDMYDEIYAEGSMMDTSADIFIAVKAKTGMEDEVATALETYRSDLENNTSYDANVDKIKSAEVYTNGDYVFLMILGADEFTDDGDYSEKFTEQAKKGIDALDNLFK